MEVGSRNTLIADVIESDDGALFHSVSTALIAPPGFAEEAETAATDADAKAMALASPNARSLSGSICGLAEVAVGLIERRDQ